jgi:hypothetical protein
MRLTWRSPVVLAAGLTLLVQLWLCHAFEFGSRIPLSVDINPGNFGNWRCFIPPHPQFNLDYWLGFENLSPGVGLTSLSAHLGEWFFFAVFYPLCAALAVVGAYLLLRTLGVGKMAAAAGGLVYGWQGWLLTNLLSGHFAPAEYLAWQPFALALVIRSVQRRSWRDAALAGGFTGLVVGIGFDRGMLSSLLIGGAGLFAIWHYLRKESRAVAPALARLAFTVVVAFAVAAQNMLPILKTQSQNIVRGQSKDPAQEFAWATQWSQTPEDYLTYLVPGLFGWRIGMVDDEGKPAGTYWGRIGRSEGWTPANKQGMRNFYQECTGFGTAGAALVLLGVALVFRRREGPDDLPAPGADQRAWGIFFLAASVVCVVLAMGKFTPFYAAFYKLPLMNSWRNPHKFLYVFHVCCAVFAGFGMDAVTRWLAGRRSASAMPRLASRVLWGVTVVCAVMWGWLMLNRDSLSVQLAREGYAVAEAAAALSASKSAALVATLVAAALAMAMRWIARHPAHTRWERFGGAPGAFACAAAALVMLQMAWVFSHHIQAYDWRGFYVENSAEFLKAAQPIQPGQPAAPGRVKVFNNEDPLLHNHLTYTLPYHGLQAVDIPAASRVPDDYAGFFGAVMPADNASLWKLSRYWHLAGVRRVLAPAALIGQLNALPGLASNVARVDFFLPQPRSETDFTFFNMRLAPVADPRTLPPQAQGQLRAVIHLKDALSKVSVVPAVEVFPDGDSVTRRLADAAWQPESSVLVTAADAAGWPTSGTSTNGTKLNVTRYDRHRIEVEVSSPAPCFLRVNDRWDAGWTAEINGRRVPLARSEVLLRALAVPAGDSRITLTYEPATTGVWVGLGVLVALVAWWGLTFRQDLGAGEERAAV